MNTGNFESVLVANRGEIAVRVLRTARRLGYRTIAVYSDADRDAPHVRAADTAIYIGPAPATESYLSGERILGAAWGSGADAIHPGYGFLAENADFAAACQGAQLVFVGPGPDAIRQMGDKAEAKRLVEAAGVPLLPGYQGEEQSEERLCSEAERLGFPLMVKAVAGGGGKGMRLVTEPEQLAAALKGARREAEAAFGSGELLLERALVGPRHVEIQVLADTHGTVLSLGERDCSIQRRHQKVIEEAPSPAVDPALREKMGRAAVQAAQAVGYVGAGTVEFLLDADGGFYFLEMNTRLQVEHPVTELVLGLDLVEWQLRIARGEPLALSPEDLKLHGHAIEARLYAEDPDNGFLPSVGTVHAWETPSDVRVDTGVEAGSRITAFYDPMIAKIIAHGRNRDEARRRLVTALRHTTALGVRTNRGFLIEALENEGFRAGKATTAFVSESGLAASAEPSTAQVAVGAALLQAAANREVSMRSPGLVGWTNAAWCEPLRRLEVDGLPFDVVSRSNAAGYRVTVGTTEHRVELSAGTAVVDGVSQPASVAHLSTGQLWFRLGGRDLELIDRTHAPPAAADQEGEGVLTAPMHGRVREVMAAAGDTVEVGAPLVIIEAMKMEHALCADISGTVDEVAAKGKQVAAGEVVARILSTPPG